MLTSKTYTLTYCNWYCKFVNNIYIKLYIPTNSSSPIMKVIQIESMVANEGVKPSRL